MEIPTITLEQVPEQVQKVVKWYTQGLLTEEELVQLLKHSPCLAGHVPEGSVTSSVTWG